jgi:TatD DNase family protein
MFVDSHCHLHFLDLEKLGITLDDVVQNAINNKVTNLLCVATRTEQHQELIKIAEKFPSVKISVGLHPEHADQEFPDLKDWLRLASDPSVVAIGETGLDYYHTNDKKLIDKQQDFFIQQIHIAKTVRKPLIIHTRMAQEDTINILTAEQAGLGVMHCFTESWSMAKKALDLGLYISFSGIITFNNANDLREVVKKAPLNRILIETDSPYLAPVPFRGKINQPCYVPHIAEKIAAIKNLSINEVAEATSLNYRTLFMSTLA